MWCLAAAQQAPFSFIPVFYPTCPLPNPRTNREGKKRLAFLLLFLCFFCSLILFIVPSAHHILNLDIFHNSSLFINKLFFPLSFLCKSLISRSSFTHSLLPPFSFLSFLSSSISHSILDTFPPFNILQQTSPLSTPLSLHFTPLLSTLPNLINKATRPRPSLSFTFIFHVAENPVTCTFVFLSLRDSTL